MKLSIVIPTRGDQNMKNITESLRRQTFRDFEIIFVVDKKLTKGEEMQSDLHVHYLTNITHHIVHNNASALRNLGIKEAKGDYILLMDDDEQFDDDYLEKNIKLRETYRPIIKKDFVLTPTLMYRKTGQVQNYGFKYFDFWLSRPIPLRLDKERDYIQMYSGNSLFAPAYIFKQHSFDEKLDFVAEDLDFTRGLTYSGIPMIVLRDLKIYHMERDKTLLEQARVGNEYAAYRKAKHRKVFVKKYGSLRNKIAFCLTGWRGQPAWLALKVLIYGKGMQKRKIIGALLRGTFCSIK